MRWIRDIMLLALLSAIAAGVLWYQSQKADEQAILDRTTANTQRLEREVRFRAATKAGELNARGWPMTVDPTWFDSDPPQNFLVTDDRPWIEVAGPEDAGLQHPPIRLTLDDKTAAFWYNPYEGIVRARVPIQMTDDAATAMYNAVNQVSISSINWHEKPIDVPKPKQDKVEPVAEQKDAELSRAPAPTVLVVHHKHNTSKH
jgi:hypothetical protein